MHFLRADTAAHQMLNRELRVVGGRLQTRNRSKLVGYKVWNENLHGQRGLVLLTILFVLDSLPKLPVIGRFVTDPRGLVLGLIRENAERLYHGDGVVEVVRTLWREKMTDRISCVGGDA